MKSFDSSPSDIEQILGSQTWKHKKLNSIQVQRRDIKIRSVTGKEKPRKQERFITQPYFSVPESNINTPEPSNLQFSHNFQEKKSLLTLAAPLGVINKAISGIITKDSTPTYQVPVFPKREFGKSTKSQSIIPKFENINAIMSDKAILELKFESGRIKKNARKSCKRFEILDNFMTMTNDKAIERMRTKYLSIKN